jgi:hypothetical protein
MSTLVIPAASSVWRFCQATEASSTTVILSPVACSSSLHISFHISARTSLGGVGLPHSTSAGVPLGPGAPCPAGPD